MRSLAGLSADGVLPDAILIPPRPLIPPTNTRKAKGSRKKYGTMKKGDVGMAKCFSTKYETRDKLSTTLYLQSKKLVSRWTARILFLVTKKNTAY